MDRVLLPEADVLVHAGDLTYSGTPKEISKELKILKEKAKNYKRIIVICGNHDWLGEEIPHLMKQLCDDNGITYLCDSYIEVDDKIFYGSPYQPEFCDWAFNLPRGSELAAKWALMPDKVDILITHGPPKGILDQTPYGERVGCDDLYRRVIEVRPELHVFGHIHHGYGIKHFNGITFVNAAICTEQYSPANKPIVIDL